MDKIEEQMVERFIELTLQAESAQEAAYKMGDAASDFGYMATLKFPDFLDHVSEIAKQKKMSPVSMSSFSPASLVSGLISSRGLSLSVPEKRKLKLERKDGESTRHWLERCEKIIAKRIKAKKLEVGLP